MDRFYDGFNRPGGGVMLIMLFKMLYGLFDNSASLKSGPSNDG